MTPHVNARSVVLPAFVLCFLAQDPIALNAQATGPETARAYREANEAAILREYAEFLAVPNVASDSVGIWRNAEIIRDALLARGVDSRLLTVPGAPPVVFGQLMVPGATRTLGIYVHYDGQPADPANWTFPPWEPTLLDGDLAAGARAMEFPAPGEKVDPEWRLYARSAGDDKAPLGALLPVLSAFQENGVTPTSNLVFFFEGEEEAGSPHLQQYLESYRELLEPIDLWLFFDGPVHQSGRPLLTFGVRGVTGLEVTVYGPVRPLHSGHYGNWAPVPGQMLAHLLASMKDSEGRVLVEGFYDSVEPIGESERAALEAMPDYEAELRRELGLAWTEGGNETLPERLLLPSLTIRGLSSGNTGALARNVIPATATASLGIRLVKGNDPDHMVDLVEDHIRAQGYHIVREDPDMETRISHLRVAKVTRGGGYPAARSDMNHPIIRQVISATETTAEAAGLGSLVLAPALGGSLPLYLFTEGLGKPLMVVPIANHDDLQHAPDENLRIANLWYGIDLYAHLFTMPEAVIP
jgi:acetylornithine deacetylase/succinyl-diaminopimelate desuccinylase-like protein